jgi:hypothetical protein
VRVFRQTCTPERNAIGSHTHWLEASKRVTNGIPLECPLFLSVHTVNSVQTLKATGKLTKRTDEANLPVTFDYSAADPASLVMPNNTFMTMFTDGVSVLDTSGRVGVFVPLLAAAQANPPAGLTAACRALVKQTCPGTQGHGADCSATIAANAAAFVRCSFLAHSPCLRILQVLDPMIAGGFNLQVSLFADSCCYTLCRTTEGCVALSRCNRTSELRLLLCGSHRFAEHGVYFYRWVAFYVQEPSY